MQLRFILAVVLGVLANGFVARTAQAGPLFDWLFGGRRAAPAYPVGQPVPLGNGYGYTAGYAPWGYGAPNYAAQPFSRLDLAATGYSGVDYSVPGYSGSNFSAPSYSGLFGNYYGSSQPIVGNGGVGYSAMMPNGLTAASLPAGVIPQVQQPVVPMSYVPNYASSAIRAPTTYYRPLMTTDPNTGSQVVAMAPCTSYQYLTQRVPTFGQSALYGSYQTPTVVPPARTIPGYTLPSGGIPLAQSAPSYSLPPTSLGYGPYTTYQPALVAPQTTTVVPGAQGYATTPLGATPYYSTQGYSTSGGCTGTNYSIPPVPGLTAPQAVPYSQTPTYAAPTYSAPTYSAPTQATPPATTFTPSTSQPAFPSTNPVFPSADPADASPSLPPYNGLRPQLRSIVPGVGGSESAATRPIENGGTTTVDATPDFPIMAPIPAPEGLQKPRWNPGLLRETDLTALRPITRPTDYAGQSKKIVWASFENSSGNSDEKVQPSNWDVQLKPSHAVGYGQPQLQSGLRDIRPVDSVPESKPAARPTSPRRYDNGGWKASR